MSVEKTYKCAICGNKVAGEHMTLVGKKRYCNDGCIQQKELQDRDEGYRRDCIQYMMNLNGLEQPNMVWLKLIKQYHEEANYTYKGMLITLMTMYDTWGIENKSELHAIHSIPHYYSEAKRYYADQIERRKRLKEFEENGKDFFNRRTVVVSSKDLEIKSENFAKVNKIDMDEILEDEDD